MKIQAVGEKWYYEDGDYYNNGWMVFSTGFEWKIKNPDGDVYAACYKTLAKAEQFAERKMKLPKWERRANGEGKEQDTRVSVEGIEEV